MKVKSKKRTPKKAVTVRTAPKPPRGFDLDRKIASASARIGLNNIELAVMLPPAFGRIEAIKCGKKVVDIEHIRFDEGEREAIEAAVVAALRLALRPHCIEDHLRK